MEGKQICTHQGCRKEFTDDTNNETACRYHDGKPIFHNLKKGWTCCNVVVYDWDEFQNIQGCKVGSHESKAKETEFFKSSTVSNAEKGIDNFADSSNNTTVPTVSAPVVKDIKEYEEEQRKKEEAKKKELENKPKEVVKASDGKYYCSNPGCADKTFNPENNNEDSCKHHTMLPVFHEVKKKWPCCLQESYDFDDFMKLPPCTVSKHTPKYKN
jgi:disease resistance protein